MTEEESKSFFANYSRIAPKLEFLVGDGVRTNFWDELYEAFKARYESERTEAVPIPSDTGGINY